MKFFNVRRLSWRHPLLALGCVGITGVACAPGLSRPHVNTAVKPTSVPKEKKELQVVFAAPQKLATAAAQVSVVMNQPMRALKEVDKVAPSFVTMSPAVPGRWRWVGTQAILFEPEGALPTATSFRVEVPAGTKPLDGFALKEPFVFEFETARPALVKVEPHGESEDLDLNTAFRLEFNQPITPEDLKSAVRVSARPADKKDAPATTLEVVIDPPDAKEPTVLRVHAKDPLPKASEIKLVVTPELKGKVGPLTSGKREERSFRTYGLPEVLELYCDTFFKSGHRACSPEPWRTVALGLSSPVDAKELAAHIRIEPSIPFQVNSTNGGHFSLKANWKPSTTYRVHIRKGLTDKHSERLSQDWQGTLVMGPLEQKAESVFKGTYFIPTAQPFQLVAINHEKLNLAYVPLDENNVIKLDAIFKRFVYEDQTHQLEDKQSVISVFSAVPGAVTQMKTNTPQNQRQIYSIPTKTLLDPKTKTGVFAVTYDLGPGSDGDGRLIRRNIVQSTDISMQAKFSRFGSFLRITSASTGVPIAGAKVTMYRPAIPTEDEPPAPPPTPIHFNSDSDGFVHIPAEIFDTVVVKTEKDWAFFPLHRYSMNAVENQVLQPFGMFFGERHVYRPGETAHLKGIVREEARAGVDQHARILKDKKVLVQLKNARSEVAYENSLEITRFGTFSLDYTIPDTAPLGKMSAKVSVDDQELTLDDSIFEIAEYRSNEIAVRASPDKPFYIHGDTPSFRIHAESYSGVPLAGKTVTAVYWREAAGDGQTGNGFRPPNVALNFLTDEVGFRFQDEKRQESNHQRREVTLDAFGNATVDAVLDPHEPIGAERLIFNAEVSEAGGQPVAATSSVNLHPASFYLAVSGPPEGFIHWDAAVKPKVLAVDPTGKTISNVAVHLELMERSRVNVDQYKDQVLSSCDMKTGAEPASCGLSFENPGYFLIRATAADDKGRKVAASRWILHLPPEEHELRLLQNNTSKLMMFADQSAYHIGDKAKISVQSPYEKAEALVTVERNGIYQQRVVELTGLSPTLDVPVTGDMWPNADVYVILTEKGKTNKDTAIAHHYGSLSLTLLPNERKLSISLNAQNELKPGTPLQVEIDVRDPSGSAASAEVTLYAVDEGVLSLSGEKSPDPLDFFAQPRDSRVSAFDSWQDLGVFPSPEVPSKPSVDLRHFGRKYGWNGSITQVRQATTFSASGTYGAPVAPVRRDFRTTAYYNPSLITDAQGKIKTSFPLPDSFSSYRIVAIAVGENDMMGTAETNVRTTHDLMLRPITPRFFRVGDKPYVGAVVSSLLPGRNEIEVELQADGLDATGERKQRVTLENDQSKEVRFELNANRVGKAKLRLFGRSGKTADSVVIEREIRLPVPPETVALYGDTNGEQSEEVGPFADLRTDIGGMDIELSNSALVGLSDTVTELLEAPYGSTEELVSRLVAILASRDVSKAMGVTPPPGMEQLAKETVDKIRGAQRQYEGSFGDWSSSPKSNTFVTAYSMIGLSLAKQKGIVVPDATIDAGVKFLSKYLIAQFEKPKPAIDSAKNMPNNPPKPSDQPKLDEGLGFVVDALVEAEIAKPFTIPSTRLKEMIHTVIQRRTELNVASRAILLHAAIRMGSAVDPADIIEFPAMSAELDSFIRLAGPLALLVEPVTNTYNPQLDSSTRTTALVLRALLALNPDHPMGARLSRGLLSTRNGRGWGTTQEKAWALLALGDYKRGQEHTNTGFTAAVSLSGDELGRATFPNGRNSAFHFAAPVSAMSQPNALDFRVDGQGTVFYSAKLRYAFTNQPTEPLEEGLSIQRSQRAINFQNIEQALEGPPGADESTFKEGDLILVDLILTVPTPRNNVVIEDPIAAGLEPVNKGFATTSQWIADALAGDSRRKNQMATTLRLMAAQRGQPVPASAYRDDWYRQELRDDRAVFIVQHAATGLYRFQYLVRAITPGTFQRPPVRAEDMYAPDIYGRSGGTLVRVMAASASK